MVGFDVRIVVGVGTNSVFVDTAVCLYKLLEILKRLSESLPNSCKEKDLVAKKFGLCEMDNK